MFMCLFLVPKNPGSYPTCRFIPLVDCPTLGLGPYNYNVGHPEQGGWYEPTGRAPSTERMPILFYKVCEQDLLWVVFRRVRRREKPF